MFTQNDLISMTDYFCIISTNTKFQYELMSKNTLHYWKILKVGDYYNLYHKHCAKHSYHLHAQFAELLDCVLEIVNHDEWKLNIWQYKYKEKHKQKQTTFDDLVGKYIKKQTLRNI
jgi:hypothetical protein